MAKSLRDLIRDCDSLPTLPAAALRVLQLTEANNAGLDQLAEVISRDSALTSRILRAVNSTFYGVEHKVSSITQAVALLGMDSVKTLVLGFSLVSKLRATPTTGPGTGFDHLAYWRRSMYAATAARVIAVRVLPSRLDDCFVAALLMDLGTLVLDQLLGDDYGKLYAKVRSHADLRIVETHALGMTHAEVGDALAAHWRLPDALKVPIGAHHGPQDVSDAALRQVAYVVSLAGRIADVFVCDDPAETIVGVRRTFVERHGLDEHASDALLVEVGRKAAELAPLFDVRLNARVTYDDIVARASERLLELSLAAQSGEPDNKRRAARMRRDAKVSIIPCARGILGKPVLVRLRDLSSLGIGLVHAVALERGSQFVIQLAQPSGAAKHLLYTVVRCESSGGISNIGAQLAAVLRPERGAQEDTAAA